ncbi:MAG TPA: sulfurtransferase TusA family protein [Methylomirabilota bacterium]|jgi:tRNA 2-thiouridine synthesizing protein A|nr:sulfurtransferase TusA family protein [Methylomirabilota bacterium]
MSDPPADADGRRAVAAPGERAAAHELDLRGEVCPYTFLKARLVLESLPRGALLRVLVDNEPSARDVPRSLAGAGHAVLSCRPVPAGGWAIVARREGRG